MFASPLRVAHNVSVVARRLASRVLNCLTRRGLPMLHELRGGLAPIILACLTAGQAIAQVGHCMADSPVGGCVVGEVRDGAGELKPGLHVYFTQPTKRYGHNVLGNSPEWGGLAYVQQGSAGQGSLASNEFTLPKDHVFEDLTPRLVDLDADASPEIVVIESDVNRGAALAIYDILENKIVKVAETPHIGTSNRWLAPLGAADLDNDGAMELAFVDRPHLAKTLRIWRYKNGQLIEIAALSGVTNHRIGEAFISGGIRDCAGTLEIITADARWRRVIATKLIGKDLVPVDIGAFQGAASFETALACEQL